MDPRNDLPSFSDKEQLEHLGPEATAAGSDEVEKYLGLILDAFPAEVPTVSQLESNHSLPWVKAGQQQVIIFVRSLREQYRRK